MSTVLRWLKIFSFIPNIYNTSQKNDIAKLQDLLGIRIILLMDMYQKWMFIAKVLTI